MTNEEEMSLASTNPETGEPNQEAIHLSDGLDADNSTIVEEKGEEGLPGQTLSKRALKRQAKEQLWIQKRDERRKREREKIKEKKRLSKGSQDGLAVRTALVRKQLKQSTMASSSCKQRICIDLSLDSYMSEKDCKKCIKQVRRCYSLNRRAENPSQFHLTSVEGQAKETLEKNKGSENWDINYHDQAYSTAFAKEDIVYLSSESENVIRELDDSKVYIIGGLVDHNMHKGMCHRLAEAAGFSHARLPLDEYVDMKTRKVLTIDQVFDIMLRLANGENWDTAIWTVLPPRKGARLKTDANEEESDSEEQNQEEEPSLAS